MGTFFHPITLIGPDGHRVTVDALVDTGARFTSMREGVLRDLAVQPVRRARLGLADGSSHVQSLGEVTAEIDGETVQTHVIFGPEAPLPRWAPIRSKACSSASTQ